MTDSAHFDSTASSAQGYTDEDPVFISLIKKEENKTSEGFWPDSVNTSGAIVKQYNNNKSSKVDQLVGLSFQRTLNPRLTLHPFIDNFYPQMQIPLNSPPLSTVQTPLPILQNITPSNQNAKEENAKRPTTLTAQQLREIFDSSTEPSTRSTRSSFHLSYSPPHPPRAPRNFHKCPISIPRPGKNSNSYRAWPSYRQAIIDCERNTAQKLEEVRKNYEIQRSEDIKRHLLRDEYYVSAWRDRLLYPSMYLHTSQVDHLAHIFIQAADIIRQEHSIGLTFHLARHGPTIVTNDHASTYYTVCIRDIQYDLRNNEWDEFKDTTTEFELKELPSNPGIEIVSDDDSSGW
ncbi:hypothetical protein BS47DRAFT_1402821 [Hydnum rufescens UP504]|uniref:Uncharacterized protein n=1 Tax=Hydnum rufescens UP504 TaxID=1448309 RepID=A0A9P6ABH2_9AGAM|nr:hypothetical protein BS47DRAFT_1402821 [Hydnum rufescens UP504]